MTETNKKPGGAMQVDSALVRQLAELLDDTQLSEIEVQDGDRRIRVVRNLTVASPVAMPAAAASALPAASVEAAAPAGPDFRNAIKSPMVGTAYLAAEPGARNFVNVGDTVKAGDTLVIVEAMKVMNPITAPAAGVVRALLVDNGQPVEFDQPLVVVE